MIGNIFKQQPKYSDDLRVAINSINDVSRDDGEMRRTSIDLGDLRYGESVSPANRPKKASANHEIIGRGRRR